METVLKKIITENGAKVELIKPTVGHPFFRYHAGATAVLDTFKYVIRQHGKESIAPVYVEVKPGDPDPVNDDFKDFNEEMTRFLKCMEAFLDGSPATLALTNMLGIDEGKELNDDWLQKVFGTFNVDEKIKVDEAFQLHQIYGTYEFVAQFGKWKFQPGGNETVLLFPSSPDAGGNDTRLTINELVFKAFSDKNDTVLIPVRVYGSLSIKDKPYYELRMNMEHGPHKMVMNDDQMVPIGLEVFPEVFDLTFVAYPYELTVNMNQSYMKDFRFDIGIKNKNGCQLGLNGHFYVDGDVREKVNPESIRFINGNLRINELEFVNLHTLAEAIQRGIETQEEVDKYVDIDCLLKGKKIGDVKILVKEQDVILVFLDGQKASIADYFKKFFDDYFSQKKPDGSARNSSFDFSNDHSHRSEAKTSETLKDLSTQTQQKLAEGMRRRFSRQGLDTNRTMETLRSVFTTAEGPGKETGGYGYDTGHDTAYDSATHWTEEEAKRMAEEDAKRRAEEDAKRRAEEDAKRRAEEDAKRIAAEEEAKRIAAEEDAKRRAAEEDAKYRYDTGDTAYIPGTSEGTTSTPLGDKPTHTTDYGNHYHDQLIELRSGAPGMTVQRAKNYTNAEGQIRAKFMSPQQLEDLLRAEANITLEMATSDPKELDLRLMEVRTKILGKEKAPQYTKEINTLRGKYIKGEAAMTIAQEEARLFLQLFG